MNFNVLFIIAGLLAPLAAYLVAKRKGVELSFIFHLVLGGIFIWSGFKGAVHFGLMPESTAFQMLTLERINVPKGSVVADQGRVMQRTAEPVKAASVPPIRTDFYGWNAQLAQILANGGITTAPNSIMGRYGLNVQFKRINSNNTLMADALAFAKAMKNGERHPTTGAHIIELMGDGTGPFISNLNRPIIAELGAEYRYVIVGSAGQSLGEDKWVVPAEWVKDPTVARPELKSLDLLKGEVVLTVPGDGDMDIVINFAGDNGLCINPDPKTLDLGCINIEPALENDYMQAAIQFSNGATTTRKVVRNGKPTGETRTVPVKMCATWTPGDAYIFEHRGGVVSLADTLLYSGQMPNFIMICNKWAKENPTAVEAYLSATHEAGDLVKRDPKALSEGARLSAIVYGEKDGAFWEAMYKGLVSHDAQGNYMRLGGSRVYDLADAFRLFGLEAGRDNLAKATYTVFGNAIAKLYPGDVPNVYPFEEVSDLSYLRAIEGRVASGVAYGESINAIATGGRSQVGKRQVEIQFVFGQANFAQGQDEKLQDLKQQLLICKDCTIEVNGHTDSVGTRAANIALSEARAQALVAWLRSNAPGNFPAGKIKSQGFGPDQPKYSNTTDDGRARNRRVETVLYSTQ